MDDIQEPLKAVRRRLDKVSPSFCLAKWLQVSVHLESGLTHSCHHPDAHLVAVDQVRGDPSALHNSSFKMFQRYLMLKGVRPKECQYCWAVEDLGPSYISDRILKSAEPWALPDLENVATAPWNRPVNPRYMEVSFSRACNLKCSYCSAQYSTKWQSEINQYGPYPTGHGKPHFVPWREEENPYIQAFWKWWPEARKDLRVFRITGGEPLLSPNTFRVLSHLAEEDLPHLSLAINSNMMAPSAVMDRFLSLIPQVERRLKNVMVFTSLDGWGPQAEYIRHGLVVKEMWSNVERYLAQGARSQLTFMVTLNALSLFSFKDFLSRILDLRRRFPKMGNDARILADISYLVNPQHQCLKILPEEFWPQAEAVLTWMRENAESSQRPEGFLGHEIIKFERALKWMKESWPAGESMRRMGDFFMFFNEHDRRRGTDFLATFPELADFYRECEHVARSHFGYRFYSFSKVNYQRAWQWWAKKRGLMQSADI